MSRLPPRLVPCAPRTVALRHRLTLPALRTRALLATTRLDPATISIPAYSR